MKLVVRRPLGRPTKRTQMLSVGSPLVKPELPVHPLKSPMPADQARNSVTRTPCIICRTFHRATWLLLDSNVRGRMRIG
jgi:hypothetical protein